jgi:hypothetical protein
VEDALICSVLYLSRWPCCPISGVSVAGISHDPVDCNGNVLWIGDRGRCRGRGTPFGNEVTLKVTVYRHLGTGKDGDVCEPSNRVQRFGQRVLRTKWVVNYLTKEGFGLLKFRSNKELETWKAALTLKTPAEH